MKTLKTLSFKNHFFQIGGEFYQLKNPVPVADPSLICFSSEVARKMGINPDEFLGRDILNYLSGNKLIPNTKPLAMVYSGHQFGVYNPQLGDGRGLLLGDFFNEEGDKWDLYLKGSGQTRFCRGFDGRATLKSSIREFLAGEALAGLGVPTTRALAVIAIGELVYRELPEPAAILSRVAKTHVRFGNFEYFHYNNQPEKITLLFDHIIECYFPHLSNHPVKYQELFKNIIEKTAYLIACWQSVGFTHGVMNTDNMSILGETFDFGPYAFIDKFNPTFTPNHSDTHGRYAYGHQPEIGYWNLGKLGETLGHLIPPENRKKELEEYKKLFNSYHLKLMGKKLGLRIIDVELDTLITELFKLLFNHKPDFTNFFRKLGTHRTGGLEELKIFFHNNPKEFDDWLKEYEKLLRRENISPEEQKARMNSANPKFILRNYLIQGALDKALKESDFSEIERLQILMRYPFHERHEIFNKHNINPDLYSLDTPDSFLGMQTSCSA